MRSRNASRRTTAPSRSDVDTDEDEDDEDDNEDDDDSAADKQRRGEANAYADLDAKKPMLVAMMQKIHARTTGQAIELTTLSRRHAPADDPRAEEAEKSWTEFFRSTPTRSLLRGRGREASAAHHQ